LCQICRDHPRFKTSFTNITETGLGFCCEEATKIIFSFTDKISPVLVSDDFNNEEVTFLENAVLDFKKQALGVLQDRNAPINDRINNLLNLCNANFIKNYGKKIIKKFCLLEKLSKSWGARLKAVKNANFNLTVDENLSLYCEQFLVNSLYRHLSTAEDIINAYAITVACVISWALIQLIYKTEVCGGICSGSEFLTLIDITRDFSSNVEYSPNNVNKLFNFAYKFVY
jgi:lysine-N-methylase